MFLWFLSQPSYYLFIGGRATDFSELVLYLAPLLKVFISCRSSLVKFLGLLVYTILLFANSESLTSFPICISLISFCCLITIARTLSTILKRYGESGQPCFVPDFSGISLSFSSFNLMSAVGLLYIAFFFFLKKNSVSVCYTHLPGPTKIEV